MSISGRDRTRTCKGLRLVRFPSGCHRACWLALPYSSCPGRTRTCNRLVNSEPLYRLSYKAISSVRMAGFEPAFSSTPSWRIARLSYILTRGSSGGWGRTSGLRVFSAALLPPELHRNQSETPAGVEPASSRVAADRLAVRPRRHQDQEPAVGLEPTWSALRGRCPACRASPACWSSQCWCRANSTEVQSLSPLPRAWPEEDPEPAAGLEPARAPLQEGCSSRRAALASRGWPAGVEPAQPRFTAGSRCRFEFGHSAPTWNRTRNSAFAEPRDVPFTIEARTVPRPGVEPGPAPSEGAMMSLSPPGQQSSSDQGGT